MELKYERWVTGRLINKARCLVEKSMTCIPLRGDPICRACYEAMESGQCRKPPGKGPARESRMMENAAA